MTKPSQIDRVPSPCDQSIHSSSRNKTCQLFFYQATFCPTLTKAQARHLSYPKPDSLDTNLLLTQNIIGINFLQVLLPNRAKPSIISLLMIVIQPSCECLDFFPTAFLRLHCITLIFPWWWTFLPNPFWQLIVFPIWNRACGMILHHVDGNLFSFLGFVEML